MIALAQINDSTKQYRIYAPGIEKDNLSIRIEGRVVTISVKEEKKEEGWTDYWYSSINQFEQEINSLVKDLGIIGFRGFKPLMGDVESKIKKFTNKVQFKLNYDPDLGKAESELKDGILTLTIPSNEAGCEISIK